MSPMRLGFYAAQNTLPAAAPFPVSLMTGVGNVAVSRTGNDYYLWQDHGGGEWIRWKLEEFSGFGYTGRTLAACDLMLVSDPIGGSGITRSGTFSATYLTTQTDAYWEFTGTGSSIAMRLVFASNCGIAKVTIDGDATLANMLPTAQEWVDASRLDASALVANGGTLNPTDRILNQYHSGALTQNQVMFARGLENTSHTVRFTCTGYKRPASSAVRMQYDNSQTELIWWGTGSEDIEDTTNVKSSLIRWLYAAVSSAEYAITAWPSSGSNDGFLGGKAHGYDNEISIAFTVDGESVTPSDGQVIAGTEVGVVKHNQLHHSFDADPPSGCNRDLYPYCQRT